MTTGAWDEMAEYVLSTLTAPFATCRLFLPPLPSGFEVGSEEQSPREKMLENLLCWQVS